MTQTDNEMPDRLWFCPDDDEMVAYEREYADGLVEYLRADTVNPLIAEMRETLYQTRLALGVLPEDAFGMSRPSDGSEPWPIMKEFESKIDAILKKADKA